MSDWHTFWDMNNTDKFNTKEKDDTATNAQNTTHLSDTVKDVQRRQKFARKGINLTQQMRDSVNQNIAVHLETQRRQLDSMKSVKGRMQHFIKHGIAPRVHTLESLGGTLRVRGSIPESLKPIASRTTGCSTQRETGEGDLEMSGGFVHPRHTALLQTTKDGKNLVASGAMVNNDDYCVYNTTGENQYSIRTPIECCDPSVEQGNNAACLNRSFMDIKSTIEHQNRGLPVGGSIECDESGNTQYVYTNVAEDTPPLDIQGEYIEPNYGTYEDAINGADKNDLLDIVDPQSKVSLQSNESNYGWISLTTLLWVLAALLILVAVILGIYFCTRGVKEAEVVADANLVEQAPSVKLPSAEEVPVEPMYPTPAPVVEEIKPKITPSAPPLPASADAALTKTNAIDTLQKQLDNLMDTMTNSLSN